MIEYRYNSNDYIITNITNYVHSDRIIVNKTNNSNYIVAYTGKGLDCDYFLCNIVIKKYISRNPKDWDIFIFVPKKYFYQVLYWAWAKGLIKFEEINLSKEEVVIGNYHFIKVEAVYGPDFYEKEGEGENPNEWYIAIRETYKDKK